jgi:hypothetical protein
VQVELPESADWWAFIESKPQGGKVCVMDVGKYDDNDCFLVVDATWKTVEPGEPKSVQPYLATMEPYMTWDALLVASAEELGVKIATPPGWIFALDES